jgi:hypothetical protein
MRSKEDSAPDRIRTPAKIGPSDTSDTVADRPGEPSTDSDAEYTGERVSAGNDPNGELREAEYGADRVVGPDEAGLGGGLDEAEEAQLGVTDEELEARGTEDDADLVKTPPEED